MTGTLSDRYRPSTFDSVQGNTNALDQIEQWAETWSPGDPPLFLCGPPGVGKSSTAFVIAETQDWHLTDVNASDARTTDDLAELVREAKTVPPDGFQLVFIDEIDNLHSSTNTDELATLLRDSPNPIVLAANDDYAVSDSLKSLCREFEFKLGKRSRRAKLNEIVDAENLDFDRDEIDLLAERPDLRSAINDLQASIDSEVRSDARQYQADPFDAVRDLLLGDSDISVDETPDSFVHWLDENWRSDASGLGSDAKDLRGIEIPMAFDALSLSDLFLRRAYRSDYRFWKYASALQKATAELRLTEPYNQRIAVDYPEWFQLSSSKPTDESPTAALYRELTHYDSGMPGLTGNYRYFTTVMLPLLRDADRQQLIQLAINYCMSDQAVPALGLTPADVTEYRGDDDWEARSPTQSVLEGW